MTYILFLIILESTGSVVIQTDEFSTMNACFEARDQVVETIGRPIINYQAVCVLKDPSIKPKPMN